MKNLQEDYPLFVKIKKKKKEYSKDIVGLKKKNKRVRRKSDEELY